jgi:O-antigen/teichoic acid export membrane protein
MSVTATKFLAQYRETDKLRAGSMMALCWVVTLTVGILSTSLIFILSPWLSGTLLRASQLTPYLRWGSFLILFGALTGAQRGMLIGLEKFKTLAFLTIFFGFLNFPLMLYLAWRFGLAGAVATLLLVEGFHWLANSYYLRRAFSSFQIHVNFGGGWMERRVLWTFSLPHVMATLLNMPVEWICNTLLVRQPGGLAQMGVFSAAYRWRQFILFLPGAVSSVSAAIHAERLEHKDYRSVRKVLRTSFFLVTGVALGASLLIGGVSPFILRQYGPGFVEEGVSVMLFVLGASTLLAMTVPFSNLVTSAGKVWQIFGGGILKGLTLIGITYSLIHLGAFGLSVAHLGGAFVALLFIIYLALPIIQKDA